MAALPLTGHALHEVEMEYHGNLDMLLERYKMFLS